MKELNFHKERLEFEELITSRVNTKYSSKEYAIKRDKHGEYVKYETRVAWEWFKLGIVTERHPNE